MLLCVDVRLWSAAAKDSVSFALVVLSGGAAGHPGLGATDFKGGSARFSTTLAGFMILVVFMAPIGSFASCLFAV